MIKPNKSLQVYEYPILNNSEEPNDTLTPKRRPAIKKVGDEQATAHQNALI